MAGKPTHQLNIGTPIPNRRQKNWTRVGVGWWDENKRQMALKLNIRLHLEPGDTVFLFPIGESDAEFAKQLERIEGGADPF